MTPRGDDWPYERRPVCKAGCSRVRRRSVRRAAAERAARSRGTPFTQRNVLRALKTAADAADATDAITLHDLPRMTASILVATGVDITTAAAILGNKNASILLDVYAKAPRAPKVDAIGRVERTLFGPATAPTLAPAASPVAVLTG